MRYKIWTVAQPDHQGRKHLEQEGLHPLTAAVLSARGMTSVEQARQYLSMADAPLEDSLLMRDMDRAVARVRQALNRGEKIAVYGDYDVDGITATCLLTRFLTQQGGDVTAYIPDRLEEGYGLNRGAVSTLARQGVKLIVTVDCGITAVEEVLWAASLGVDVVITDHHECKNVLPAACAVVDPHRPDCDYPFKGLAGVGVALKLVMALAGAQEQERMLDTYADLAAIGTVADVMPVTGENRTIIQRGLRVLECRPRPGIAALVAQSGLEGRAVNSVTIGYTLAPRINAAGRMGCADIAVELLLTDDLARAEELASELCRLNKERQGVEMGIYEQCVRRLERSPQPDAIVLADEGWHQGVVGIVASRLTEQYNCPAMMICLSQGMGKGSCRSYGGINLFNLLEGCQDLLEAFGGHELAAGFTVREENIAALRQRVAQLVRAQRTGDSADSTLDVDVQLDELHDLDIAGVEQLEKLEPYGAGNPRPVLAVMGARVVSRSMVGGGRHLKLKLNKQGISLDAIFFSAGDWLPEQDSLVDAAFSPQINEFRGQRSVQLQLVDLRPSQQEQELYRRYLQGLELTAQQARRLLPVREEFVLLWRWLKRQSEQAGPPVQSAAAMAAAVARAAGTKADPLHTRVCLDVLAERGLARVSAAEDRLRVELIPTAEKVDLDASDILRRLRSLAGQE
ncbi:MAG: single-stranded-DNA-specific exonuclease RecJ [Ruminococcaceae bacterium]|nr:single-stranded-DNA-specific exonuclease RecJ [Oscillospiraceae bacterium]